MNVCKLDLNTEDPKLAQIIINGLKEIASTCSKEIGTINDKYRWNSSTMSYKDAKRTNEICLVLMELATQIEACEDGSKLIED